MPTPTPSGSVSVDALLNQFKPEVRKQAGYSAPPQIKVRAKLNQNENPFDLPVSWKDHVLHEIRSLDWSRYPLYEPPELRARLADRFDLNADQILLGNGSNQLLYTVANALIRPGDSVVITPPSFSLFDLVAEINGGILNPVMQKADFTYDTGPLLKACAGARLSMFCSPNNPTGRSMDPDLLKDILGVSPGFVLFDEAYGEFNHTTAAPLISEHPNLLVMRTFSKAFGLAGFRIGYLMAHPAVAEEIRKVNLPYNLNLFSILIGLRILESGEWVNMHVDEIIAQRDRLFERMKKIRGVTPFPSEANFISFRVPDGPRVLNRLQDLGILVRNMGYYPLMENCLRVTVGSADENDMFIEAITRVMSQ